MEAERGHLGADQSWEEGRIDRGGLCHVLSFPGLNVLHRAAQTYASDLACPNPSNPIEQTGGLLGVRGKKTLTPISSLQLVLHWITLYSYPGQSGGYLAQWHQRRLGLGCHSLYQKCKPKL